MIGPVAVAVAVAVAVVVGAVPASGAVTVTSFGDFASVQAAPSATVATATAPRTAFRAAREATQSRPGASVGPHVTVRCSV